MFQVSGFRFQVLGFRFQVSKIYDEGGGEGLVNYEFLTADGSTNEELQMEN
jgi:hypothetical protein